MNNNVPFPIQEPAIKRAARLMLVIGGARSGKSGFAEKLALRSERRVAFIATATASDDDMRVRIERHQAERPQDWHTIEEPLRLAEAVREAAGVADVLILDCITVWLSNWLFARGDGLMENEQLFVSAHYNDTLLAEIDALVQTLTELDSTKILIIVSNEVGLGIVPAYTLGRVYRDMLGRVNQRLAASAERVYLMVAGLGLDIKRLHEEALL